MYILHTFQKLNVVTVYFLPGNHLYAQSASWTSHIDNLEDEYSLLSISANTVARVGVACAWLIGQSTVAVGRRWDAPAGVGALPSADESPFLGTRRKYRRRAAPAENDALHFSNTLRVYWFRQHASNCKLCQSVVFNSAKCMNIVNLLSVFLQDYDTICK